jgi:hypothetical protein
MREKLLILVIIVYFLEENNIIINYMNTIFDISSNFLNNIMQNQNNKETFDISSNFIDKTNEFFTPYKKALTALFTLLIVLYILISSNMIGVTKLNVYFHLIYSLVLIYLFLLIVT